MTMPNFLLIGAAKAGTTALYQYLKQHPQIYMSPFKEPHFFAYEGQMPNTQGPGDTANTAIINLNDYQALFEGASGQTAIGEASTMYLYLPRTAQRIKAHIPQAKLIAILRQPAERAYSAYIHLIRDGRETSANFAQALAAEDERINNNWGPLWHYTQVGRYYNQLKNYLDIFPREQIHICLYDDFKTNPMEVTQNIFRFLGVDPAFRPDMSVRSNISGLPKSRRFHKLLVGQNPLKQLLKPLLPQNLRNRIFADLRSRIFAKAPGLSAESRQSLTEVYREDILNLQDLIGRDLSIWFN